MYVVSLPALRQLVFHEDRLNIRVCILVQKLQEEAEIVRVAFVGVAVSIRIWSEASRNSSPGAYLAVFLAGGVHDIL